MMGDYPPCHSFLLSMPHRLYLRHQAGVVAQEGEETESHDVDDGLLVLSEINLSMNKDRVDHLVQQDERPPLRFHVRIDLDARHSDGDAPRDVAVQAEFRILAYLIVDGADTNCIYQRGKHLQCEIRVPVRDKDKRPPLGRRPAAPP